MIRENWHNLNCRAASKGQNRSECSVMSVKMLGGGAACEVLANILAAITIFRHRMTNFYIPRYFGNGGYQ